MNERAFFLSGDVVTVDKEMIEDIKEKARKTERGSYRICMHESPESDLHESIICRMKDSYGRPDKHDNTTESHSIIEGKELIIIFSDDGEILNHFTIDSVAGPFSYRINKPLYHMTIPLTEIAIDSEVKLGPFNNNSNIFPDWAPDYSDREACIAYLNKLKAKIRL